MNWLLMTATCVALVELLMRLPLLPAVRQLNTVMRKSLATMRAAGISDHWKEKAMLAYSGRTFSATLRIAACFAAFIAVALVLVTLFDMLHAGFQSFVLGWAGLLGGTVIACLYAALRSRLRHG
jgi:hypothetical protein